MLSRQMGDDMLVFRARLEHAYVYSTEVPISITEKLADFPEPAATFLMQLSLLNTPRETTTLADGYEICETTENIKHNWGFN